MGVLMSFVGACAQYPEGIFSDKKPGAQTHIEVLGDLVSNVEISEDQLELSFRGERIASFESDAEIVSSVGSFRKGRTLNFLEIDGVEFLVYGEDGAFAAECEPHPDYPLHGPEHPQCKVLGAESYDTWILCSARNSNLRTSVAEAWPGVPEAMSGDLGMRCWKDGVLETSDRFFTY